MLPMSPRILLTSFDVWEPHQRSNASDDLLELLGDRLPPQTHCLRRIPVDFQQAPAMVLDQMATLRPDLILCCGMAESRTVLTVESNGKFQSDVRQTAIALPALIQNLRATEISHDAGNFVCNYLYYTLLKQIQDQHLPSQCLFVHVPILTDRNQAAIGNDFVELLQTLHQQALNRRIAQSVFASGPFTAL
jgi:pyroglutamyl-peptidase